MLRAHRIALARSLLAFGVMGLMGCQQLMGPPQPRHASILDGSGPSPVITKAQEADAQVALGRVAEQQGDLEGAMAAYQSALERDRKRADIYQRMAILNDKQGKFRESAELYRQALEADPGNADIFCDMGYSLYLQRRWSEAEMNLRQAIVRDAEHRRAHNNLGLVLAHNAHLDEALKEFRKGGCDETQARENLGFALSTERRWSEARQQYQLAMKVAPTPSSTVAEKRIQEIDAVVAKLEAPTQRRAIASADPGVVRTSATAIAPMSPGAVAQRTSATAETASVRSKPPASAVRMPPGAIAVDTRDAQPTVSPK